MNVLFVIPPETHSIESSVPKGLESGKGVYPKLGLLYVAAYLEDQTGIVPSIVDCPAERLDYDQLEARLARESPDIVGISTLTFNLIDTWKTIKLIKRLHPTTKVCVGGQHVTLYPRETLALEGVDFVVAGEGERVFTWLVEALARGDGPAELEKLPGLGFQLDGKTHLHPAQDKLPNLDMLPMPARHLVDLENYDHIAAEGQQTMSGGGDDDATKQSGIERRRKELGLDKPLYEQYALWIWNMGQGNFGRSTKYEAPVAPLMWEAMGVTIKLNLISLLIVYVISIPLGVHAAIRRGKPEEKAIGISLFGMFSAPSFWVATLLLFYFCNPANLNWFDPVGLHSQGYQDLPLNGQLRDWAWHAVLPVICMTYSGLAMLSRFARTGMLEVIRKDYIRTARAKGLPERQVILKHALRNSLIPIVTLMAALLPGMIGGSVIIEYIFTIKGMGKLGFDAILSRDYDMIMAITTLSAVLVMFGMLLSDLLYTVVDPRISLEG